MRSVASGPLGLLLCLALPQPARGITWDFDVPGEAQGWSARGTMHNTITHRQVLTGEVADGVWRVPLLPSGATLVSPRIALDSSLFDRVTVRYRMPRRGLVEILRSLSWTNEANRSTPGYDPDYWGGDESRFLSHSGYVYPGSSWQEVVFPGLDSGYAPAVGPHIERHAVVWEGELDDIRLTITPRDDDSTPEDWQVEIDWITLTGVNEQLQGPLPPPQAAAPPGPPGQVLSPSVFQSLGSEGLGAADALRYGPGAILGDIDGDGDLDLAVHQATEAERSDGLHVMRRALLLARNTGEGVFHRDYWLELAMDRMGSIWGDDFTGDGLMDLVLIEGHVVQLMPAQSGSRYGPVAMAFDDPDLYPLGVGDANGDGHADLFRWTYDHNESLVTVDLGNGLDSFPDRAGMGLQPPQVDMVPRLPLVRPALAGVTGVLWGSSGVSGRGLWATYLDDSHISHQVALGTAVDVDLVRYAGDLDEDGDIDLMVSVEPTGLFGRHYRGLVMLEGNGLGELAEIWRDDELQLAANPLWVDVTGDGRREVLVVHADSRAPSLVLVRGLVEGQPEVEGWYPFSGDGGEPLAGDVNGDGLLDVVVIERGLDREGGVHVFYNRGAQDGTAILEDRAVPVPRRARVGEAFPNPCNPGTAIPVTLTVSAGPAHLTVYDILGRPVRQLVTGLLQAGQHLIRWDGADDHGAPVASGVYVYRLRVGDQVATGKLVKLD